MKKPNKVPKEWKDLPDWAWESGFEANDKLISLFNKLYNKSKRKAYGGKDPNYSPLGRTPAQRKLAKFFNYLDSIKEKKPMKYVPTNLKYMYFGGPHQKNRDGGKMYHRKGPIMEPYDTGQIRGVATTRRYWFG